MIVLDTNVLSELIRPEPDEKVTTWLDSLSPMEVATTAITAAELYYEVQRLPDGRRKKQLAEAVHELIEEDFNGRLEAFDATAADHYATIVSERETCGRPISMADGQIAAICRRRGATLATRNTSDFEGTGIELVDPWDGPRNARP